MDTLVRERLETGFHNVIWNGLDRSGSMVSAGMYFYEFKSEEFSQVKKMVFLK